MNQKYLHKNNSRSLFILTVIGLLTLLFGSMVALANDNKVTVLTSTLNVRYGPGLSHEILTQVHDEDQLNVLGEENQWYKVRLESNQIGWVASWLVENEEVSTDNQLYGRVTKSEVNVRQFPDNGFSDFRHRQTRRRISDPVPGKRLGPNPLRAACRLAACRPDRRHRPAGRD
ncbi:MAG: SH3 domain-containing protein [Alkalibacterium sp.]|nr:SH3 domain-containing protein [Alkalibacterium sp.]